MHSGDQQIIATILSSGAKQGELRIVPIYRGGRLLLALPMERGLALATVDLYQPQKLKGRLFKSLLSFAVKSGVYRRFSKETVAVGEDGLLPLIEKYEGSATLGFLLGNPEGQHRNLIAVIPGRKGYKVVKAGSGGGVEILQNEHAMTKAFGQHTEGVPRCFWGEDFDAGFAYAAERVVGESPRGQQDDIKVSTLLGRWLDAGEKCRLGQLDVWKKLQVVTEGLGGIAHVVRELGHCEVVSPVMHGDFAPWNIKVNQQGELKVLDWEFAVPHGVPAWDGIHYHVQRMSLVEGCSDEIIYKRVQEWLGTETMQAYLKKAGLLGREEALFVAYCYYSSLVLEYPRAGLISRWKGEGRE